MTDSSDKEVHTTNPEEFEGQPLKIFEIEGDLWDYDKVAKTVRLLAREFLERFYPSTFIDHERITMLNRLTNSISKDHPVGFGTDLFIPGYPQELRKDVSTFAKDMADLIKGVYVGSEITTGYPFTLEHKEQPAWNTWQSSSLGLDPKIFMKGRGRVKIQVAHYTPDAAVELPT